MESATGTTEDAHEDVIMASACTMEDEAPNNGIVHEISSHIHESNGCNPMTNNQDTAHGSGDRNEQHPESSSSRDVKGSTDMPPPSIVPYREHAPAASTPAATSSSSRDGATGASPSSSYQQPSWGGSPEGIPYKIEILKNGTIIETVDVSSKPFCTFGRSPCTDFLLEHPTSSRLHAVLQFREDDGSATLYDAGSSHGTRVNKRKLAPKVYEPLRVGDTFMFGASSRVYVLCGPTELMPPEGLCWAEKQAVALMKHAAKVKERELELSKAQMAVAISGAGVTWGEREDAITESQEVVDWRVWAANNPLTEKQQKIADKIKKKEWTMSNLRTECERIRVKEKLETGLTPGQASTLVRNEQALEKLEEEIEELDEALTDSVRESMRDRRKAQGLDDEDGDAPGTAPKRRKMHNESDEEWLEGCDSEDEFYDRTAAAKRKRSKVPEKGKGASGPNVVAVESAETLHAKIEAFRGERQRLQAAIEQRQAEYAQHRETINSGSAGDSSTAVADVESAPDDDSLDTYMVSMRSKLEGDKVSALRSELSDVETQLARYERLLKIADPDGWYNPNTSSAAAAKVAAIKQLEQQRAAAAPAAAEAKRRAEQEEAVFAPEEEEGEGEGNDGEQVQPGPEQRLGQPSTSSRVPRLAGSKLVIKSGAPAGAAKSNSSGQKSQDAKAAGSSAASGSSGPSVSGAASAILPAPGSGKKVEYGLEIRHPGAVSSAPKSKVSAQAAARAAVAVEQGLALLASQRQKPEVAEADEQADVEWKPPQGQSGDGRTRLNDLYGY